MEKEVCDRLKRARKMRGLTQTDLSKIVDVNANYIYLIESGRNEPGKKTIRDICKALNVREEWVLSGVEPMELPPEDETAAYVSELLDNDENPLYDIIKAIMKTYNGVGAKEQEIIKEFARNLKANLNEESRD